MSHLPQYPWQIVGYGSDLLELKGDHYLPVVDYFSRYPEVVRLTTTTSSGVIKALQAMFSRHGIPEVLRRDNGPQYAYEEFTNFAGFWHKMSSPLFPQSNGRTERMVQTVN